MEPTLPLWDDDPEETRRSVTERHVAGCVAGVVYTSDDGQYMVVRATDRSGREFTMVGPLSGLTEGQDFEAWGAWEKHKEYGRQFRVSRCKAILPSTEEGIRRYLGSGVLPGIGATLAGRIVDKFGTQALWILDNYSTRLQEVDGIGKKRIAEIKAAWNQQQADRERDVYLQGLGVSAAYCRRIGKHFGDETVAVLQENPYRLTEVRGIGFRMADAVAQKLGIAKDHLFRLAAGCVFVVNELADRGGHCCVPQEVLEERARAVLDVDQAAVRRGLQEAIERRELVREDDLVFLRQLYRAECELAGIIRAFPQDRRDELPQTMPVSRMWPRLNDAQQHAVRQAFRHGLSIITGGPGVGKTTVTQEIVHVARQLGLKVALAAPTGRAAKRLSESCGMPAKTIHRMLKWEPKTGTFFYNVDHKFPADVLIVDEVSMIDLPLAVSLFRALAYSTRVVLVGDRDQLPSVGPGSVLGDLIASGAMAVQELTEIFRQAEGSAIVSNAHLVNAGKLPDLRPPANRDELRDFYWIEQDEPEEVLNLLQELITRRIPQRFGYAADTDIQLLTPMNRGLCGTQNLNATLKQLMNPTPAGAPAIPFGEVRLGVGDRVMQVVNNYDLGVFNGDMGTVKAVFPAAQQVQVLFDTGEAMYSISEAYEQLKLAYAITIHKSQGSEFPAVVMPILTAHFVMLQRNLIYTGMTRAKKLLVVVGSRKALAMAVNNFNRSPRHTRLTARISG